MENQPIESAILPSVWDRLRASLEQMRVAQEQRGGAAAREKIRAERAKVLRLHAASAAPASIPLYFLAFSKGQQRYGITVENVLEVQTLEQFSTVPGSPTAIIGVVHWRGAILALLDLSRLFEVVETGLSDLHAYIVVEAAGKRMAVAASQVNDIVAVPRERLKVAPELPQKIAPEWVIGVHDANQLILKMEEIFKHLQHLNKK